MTKSRPFIDDPDDDFRTAATPIESLIAEFIRGWGAGARLSVRTTSDFDQAFGEFTSWLARQGLPLEIGSITRPRLQAYLVWLSTRPKRGGSGGTLALASVATLFRPLRAFLNWATFCGLFEDSPADGVIVQSPSPTPTPRAGDEAVAAARAGLSGTSLNSLRDRAILQLIVGAGLTSLEITCLRFGDIDLEAGRIHVRMKAGIATCQLGLGVYVALCAYVWGRNTSGESTHVFVTRSGGALRPHSVSRLLRAAAHRGGYDGPLTASAVRRHALREN